MSTFGDFFVPRLRRYSEGQERDERGRFRFGPGSNVEHEGVRHIVMGHEGETHSWIRQPGSPIMRLVPDKDLKGHNPESDPLKAQSFRAPTPEQIHAFQATAH